MNAIKNTNSHALAAVNGPASGTAARYVMTVGETACEVRGRMVAEIAEVLGFEEEMDVAVAGFVDVAALVGDSADSRTIIDLLDSRMIAPPRPRRRRQRAVSSRAVFYGTRSH